MTERIRKAWHGTSPAMRALIVCAFSLCVCLVVTLAIAGGSSREQSEDWEDPDFDGFPTILEQALGTDPQDCQSHPALADNHEKILAYWPLATNAIEALGIGLDGEPKHGASFADSAVVLDGKNDYINFGNDSLLSVKENLSWCLWLNPAVSAEDDDFGLRRILGKYQTKGNNREHATHLAPNGRVWTFLSDNGTASRSHTILRTIKNRTLKNGEWQHLAITWDSTNSAVGVSCYVNGIEQALRSQTAAGITNLHTGTADLTLGAYAIRKPGRAGPKNTLPSSHPDNAASSKEKENVINSFKGSMAQLILCQGVLSDLEVREIHFLGREGDLLGWLDMDYDEDEMPDWWERKYFGNVRQEPQDDFDGDGLSNLDEYLWATSPVDQDSDGDGASDGIEVARGTDPADPLSTPPSIAGTIQYQGWQRGRVTVLAAEAPASWLSEHMTTIHSPGPYQISHVFHHTNYWLKAYVDFNWNGARDSLEAWGVCTLNPLSLTADVAGVDITLADLDADEDSLPDWWEVVYLDPDLSGTPEDDRDEDGRTAIQEYAARSDPQAQDTDRDGWLDGFEPTYAVSRAFIDWGDPRYTIADDWLYTAPAWLLRAHQQGGEWIYPEPPGPLPANVL